MITLRAIKVYDKLSEETLCFTATVYSGARKIGFARNDGRGGCNRYDWTDVDTARVALAGVGLGIHHDGLDQFFDDLLFREDIRKNLTKSCAKGTLFRLKGDAPTGWRSVKLNGKDAVYTPSVRQWLLKTHGDNIDVIANDDIGRAVDVEFAMTKATERSA